MTGEMSREDVTREAYPLHFAIADAFKGRVRPFDQYQGPFVDAGTAGKFWIQSYLMPCNYGHEHDTGLVQVYNARTDKLSDPFSPAALKMAIQAAEETLAL